MNYHDFLEAKAQVGTACGFEPSWLPEFLYPFQRALVEWAVRKGRAAVFADCGLGKTPIQLAWAENVVRHTNRPVLFVTTLGDSAQTLREAEKFGVSAARSKDGKLPAGARVVVTNYERLQHFDPADFAAACGNEASCVKDFKGRRKALVTEFMRTLPYRLLATATAAPNDYHELGTAAEVLGEMGFQDMVTRFFSKHLAARGTKYRMKGHAERDFWRWVCSWARAVRRPSDLGFDDGPFLLPELSVREHSVRPASPRPGFLFDMPAVSLADQREELRRTLRERCELAASLLTHGRPALAWCHLNPEGDLLERLTPGAVQVSGSDPDERKEEVFEAFAAGQVRVLVTKPKIGGYGLNWQHCAHMSFFVSHSWEQWYQCVRRCWRFGQPLPVGVEIVSTPGTAGVLANLKRKQDQADRMFGRLVELVNQSLHMGRSPYGDREEEVPAWLSSTRN